MTRYVSEHLSTGPPESSAALVVGFVMIARAGAADDEQGRVVREKRRSIPGKSFASGLAFVVTGVLLTGGTTIGSTLPGRARAAAATCVVKALEPRFVANVGILGTSIYGCRQTFRRSHEQVMFQINRNGTWVNQVSNHASARIVAHRTYSLTVSVFGCAPFVVRTVFRLRPGNGQLYTGTSAAATITCPPPPSASLRPRPFK